MIIAARWNEPGQGVGIKDPGAGRALNQRLVGDEGTGQAQHGLSPGLLHDKRGATETGFSLRGKANHRRLRKQSRGQGLLRESLQAAA